MKRGFLTKKEALQHEAKMRQKLLNPTYETATASQGKISPKEYLENWVERHGKVNLRPSMLRGYRGNIQNHIVPFIGHLRLQQITPAIIDEMLAKLFDKGLSISSVKYVQRTLSVALEAARQYHYIPSNPAKEIITKFGKPSKTPDPYTIKEMQYLLAKVADTKWDMLVMLGGIYGLRISEAIGLRWGNVDLVNGHFSVVEQMMQQIPAGLKRVDDLAPLKSESRTLPITGAARPYFERQLALQERQRQLTERSGEPYYDNGLVIARPDGAPQRRETLSSDFGQLLKHVEMRHIRFHDLRHAAATNMYELTGDFYAVAKILGHSLKGTGLQLGLGGDLDMVTARYVDVRTDRVKFVLDNYHQTLFSELIEKKHAGKQSDKNGRKVVEPIR
jgi:integrase